MSEAGNIIESVYRSIAEDDCESFRKYIGDYPELLTFRDEEGSFGGTLLHRAASWKAVKIGRILIDNNADIQAVDQAGNSPLHIAASCGSFDVAKMLIEMGASINACDNRGYTPLHWAVAVRGGEEVTALLIENGADVNKKAECAKTPLHMAADGQMKCAEILLSRGANINDKDEYEGKTALHWAASWCSAEVVELLVKNGAGINETDERGYTPLHWAAAVENGTRTAEILIENGAEINPLTSLGKTPLKFAQELGHRKTAELLIKHGGIVGKKSA